MDSRQQYIHEMQTAYLDDEHQGIVPDGTRLTISMHMMDSTQRAAQSHQMDAQPELDPEKAIALCNAQANHDRVQGFADHYTRQRNLRTLAERPATAYDQYVHSLSNQWRAA